MARCMRMEQAIGPPSREKTRMRKKNGKTQKWRGNNSGMSYTRESNHLKRFIALQNLTPAVQRLHPFTTPTGWTGDGGITIGHAGFLWRISHGEYESTEFG